LKPYWATLTRYFSSVDPDEISKVRAMSMREGEAVQQWSARLQGRVETVNQAAREDGCISSISQEEAVAIFLGGLVKDGRFTDLIREMMPQLRMITGEARTLVRISNRVHLAYVNKLRQDEELAKLGISLQLQEQPARTTTAARAVAQQAGSSGGAGGSSADENRVYFDRHGSQRSLAAGVNRLDAATQHSLLRVLLKKTGLPEHLADPPAAGAAGAGGNAGGGQGAGGGLRQHQLLQRQAGGAAQQQGQRHQADRADARPCQCVEPRHGPNATCFVANPQLAYAGWQPPRRGSPDFTTYEQNCRQHGLQAPPQAAAVQHAAGGQQQ
jgi:hypothetical protein